MKISNGGLGKIVRRLGEDLNESPGKLMTYVAKLESELYSKRNATNPGSERYGFYYSAVGRIRKMYKENKINPEKNDY